MKDEIKVTDQITIPLNTVINWMLKGTFNIIPKVANYLLPKWKRKRILRDLTGESKNDPKPPSDEEIINS